MSDTYRIELGGRTSWGRFALALGILTAMATTAMLMIAEGALAAGFKVSGQQFKVSASSMDGTGFVNYGFFDQKADGSAEPIAVAAMKRAEMHDLCQSVLTSLPIIGDVSLKLTAGTGDTPVVAENLFIDMTQMNGDALFKNIEIGRDASTLNKGPAGSQGLQGLFSQQADTVHIENLQQVAWATNAGTFNLTGLSMNIIKGKDECF